MCGSNFTTNVQKTLFINLQENVHFETREQFSVFFTQPEFIN